MKKFIEFFGSAHWNNQNVAAYKTANGAVLKAENVVTGRVLGARMFDSYDAAEDWFSNLPGANNLSRLDSAIGALVRN
jgi:hypothetical protein